MKANVLSIILIAIFLLLLGGVVGYSIKDIQYNKVYEDACHMSDLIRCYKDHLYDDDTVIEDYGCFEELEGTFLYDDPEYPVNLQDYVWRY